MIKNQTTKPETVCFDVYVCAKETGQRFFSRRYRSLSLMEKAVRKLKKKYGHIGYNIEVHTISQDNNLIRS